MSRAKGVTKATITFPVEVAGYREFEHAGRYRTGLLADPSFAPYQPGDVLWFWSNGEVRLGRVVKTDSIYLMEHDYYVPKYRVQIATKEGNWSGLWEIVYPGFIEQAYFVERDHNEPRELPAVVTGLGVLEQVRRDS